jgi:hypothetical protein
VAALKITLELEQQFPSSQVMNALNIVYPQFWLAKVNDIEPLQHLDVIKNVFGLS